MITYLTLTRRELGSFFVSFIGYVVLAIAALLMGLCFVILVSSLEHLPLSLSILDLFLNFFFWMILLFSAPVITMRLFALEKSLGTFETLMTAPVNDFQVICAKFTAALVFYMILWLPLLLYIVLLRYFTNTPNIADAGALEGMFLGIFLLGCLYMAMGCFASALTKNQIIAAMISFAMGLGLYSLSFVAEHFPLQQTWANEILSSASVRAHLQNFSHGIIDTRAVVFYASLTVFFLFLTHRAVESRRWK